MAAKETDNAANFALANLSTGYNSAATTLVLSAGQGANLPSDGPFDCVWFNRTDFTQPSSDASREIISVPKGGITGDTLTGVTRGAQGTAAANHNTGGKTYALVVGPTAKHVEKTIFKDADGPVINNSTVLAADSDLQFAVAANASYEFEFDIHWTSSGSTAKLAFDLSGPAAPTMIRYSQSGFGPNTGSISAGSFSPANPLNQFNSNNGAPFDSGLKIYGCLINGANAGTVAFRRAQLAAVVENTKILAGSKLRWRRVA